jgi:hypothetical protein
VHLIVATPPLTSEISLSLAAGVQPAVDGRPTTGRSLSAAGPSERRARPASTELETLGEELALSVSRLPDTPSSIGIIYTFCPVLAAAADVQNEYINP